MMVSWIVEVSDQFKPEFFAFTGRRSDGDSGVDPASPAIRAAIGSAPRRYAKRLPPREYEGAAVSAADGEWRVAFAFDPKRRAILLVAGDKSGVSEKRFYRELIRKADERFDAHLIWLKKIKTRK
jgi:hypothetical protein